MYSPHFFSKIQMLLGPNLAHLLGAQDQGEVWTMYAKGLGTDCEAKKKARSTCTIWVKLCPAVQGY